MEGYIAEKAILEEALQQKETKEKRLAEELESTRIQLQQLNENHALLLRQREALTASLGDTEKGERVISFKMTCFSLIPRLNCITCVM